MIARKLAVLAAAVAVLTSCSEDIPTGVDLQGNIGRMRFVNAVPDPTKVPVNILVAGLPFAVNVAYGGFAPGAANPYFPVLQGMQTIAVRRTADTSVRVLDLTLDVIGGADYTVLAIGPTATVTGLVLRDDNAVPAAGQVRLRLVNASPSAPSVDVYVTAPAASIAAIPPTFGSLAFQAASGYFALPAASYQVRFTTAGTKTVVRDLTIATLAAGAVRTVVLLDAAASGTPLTSTVLTDR